MFYKYTAITRGGKFEKGAMEAPSQRVVAERLREANLLIISIVKKKERKMEMQNILRQFRGVSFLDRVMITRYLAVMIKAGVNIAEALDILREQTPSLQLKKTLARIIKAVRDGRALSDSFAMYPKIFPQLYVNVIKAGEESGTLEENLNRLAEQLEKDYDLRRRVISAMFYPILILSVTFVLGIGLAFFVLPKITKLFQSFDVQLPLSTRILLKVADIMEHYGYIALPVFIATVIFLVWFLRTKFMKPYLHQFILKIPIFGRIAQNLNLARFSRILASLLRSGLTINESLKITSETLTNVFYRNHLVKMVREVERGTKMSDILKRESRLFPPVFFRTVNVGEQTGNLEEVLLYLAQFYEEEVNSATKNLSVIIEPLLLVGIGLAIGGIAISIITPIYQISGSIGR